MYNLIKVELDQNQNPCVSARDLYQSLGLDKGQWARWHKKNITSNPYAVEGVDWSGFDIMSNGNLTKDFVLSLDFAKKIAMLARTDQGERLREYFVQCEKQLRKKEAAVLPDFTNPIEAARAWADQLEARQVAETQVLELKPKAEYAEKVLLASNEMTTTQVAKELGMSAIALNRYLKDLKIQFRSGDQFVLYAKYQDMGLAKTRTHAYNSSSTGDIKTAHNLVWTEKGREFIHSLFNDKNTDTLIKSLKP